MNDALITRDNHALASADTPEMRQFAKTLRLLLPGGEKMTDAEALAGAQYAKTTGLNPFTGDFYVVPGVGVVPGYQGELKRRTIDKRYRPLTEIEIEWNDVLPGDKAVICEGVDPAEAARARAEGRAPQVTEGFGVVRKAEQWVSYEWRSASSGKRYKASIPEEQWTKRADPPVGRSWGWVAQNRALKDCMRHMGLEVEPDADEILALAQAQGVEVDIPETARLSAMQASQAVAQAVALAQRAAEYAAMTAEQIIERAAPNVLAMRGPDTDDPLGIDTAAPVVALAPPAESATATTAEVFTLPGIAAEFEAEADAEFTSIPASPHSIHAAGNSGQAGAPGKPEKVSYKAAGLTGTPAREFNQWAAEFAEKFPVYQDKNGLADRGHILHSIARLGHQTANSDNWEQVKAEMCDHAAAQAA